MSLYGALLSGVAGLKAQTQSLATISDNISNVNTTAYKKTSVNFSTLVTGTSNGAIYSPGGVASRPVALIDQQGVVQATGRPTDVAITGNGFFPVNPLADGTGEPLYTRAGSFTEDNQGRLVNAAGYYLQGWALDAQDNPVNINQLTTVAVGTLNGVAVGTTNVDVGANLDSSQAPFAGTYNATNTAQNMQQGGVSPQFGRTIQVYDSLGTPHNVTLGVVKTATNTWQYELYVPDAEVTGVATGRGQLAYGTITFNGDGSLASVTGTPALYSGSPLAPAAIPIAWSNGATASSVKFNLGTPGAIGVGKTDGVTQFASPYNVAFINQDGAAVGLRTGVTIDRDGFVIASFSNGASKKLYQIPVTTFANPNALASRNGNAYAATTDSGSFNWRVANTGGAGRIESSALEGSNSDLGDEFAAMIITQRAYSAAAKTITTADQMLDELLSIKR
jgi:flagellar hook protein FlgE